jgi:TRAP-type C4-dicarboxylate transport system permease large subunit
MVPENVHDFFVACASVAGALIGLLFVAISVASDRLAREEAPAQVHRIRAAAALSAFTNALAVSLFALIPGQKIGPTAVATACAGIVFVVAALLSLVRRHQVRRRVLIDVLFLFGLLTTLVVQLVNGADVLARPSDSGAVYTIASMVVICFLIGIARAWELIGGPSIGITREVTALMRAHHHGAGGPADEESS